MRSRGRDHGVYGDGDVVIAAITSCTNTSNPSVLVAAGLVARKARGARPDAQALGQDQPRAGIAGGHRLSRQGSGLSEPILTQWGSTWSAMAAPLASAIRGRLPSRSPTAINEHTASSPPASCRATATSRAGRLTRRARELSSPRPPLVVAYALKGTVTEDMVDDADRPGFSDGEDVYLKDIWPSNDEVASVMTANIDDTMFRQPIRQRLCR